MGLSERTEKSNLRTFYEFPDESGCLTGQGFTFEKFFSLPVILQLSRIRPVHLNNVAAENAASGDFLSKTFQEFPGILPHFHVGFFPDFVPPKKQSNGCKTSYGSTANFPMGTQSPAEWIQSFDQIVILFSEFFLRDRKNGLASMKVFHEEVRGLFLHLQSRHLSSSYFFLDSSVDRNIQILRKLVNRNFQKEGFKEVGCLLHQRVMINLHSGVMICVRNQGNYRQSSRYRTPVGRTCHTGTHSSNCRLCMLQRILSPSSEQSIKNFLRLSFLSQFISETFI